MESLIPNLENFPVQEPIVSKPDATVAVVEDALMTQLAVAFDGRMRPVETTKALELYTPEGGSVINMYETQDDPANPQGYTILQQEVLLLQGAVDLSDPVSVMRSNRVRTIRKSVIRSGTVTDLKKFVAEIKSNKYPKARIEVLEYTESQAGQLKGMLSEEGYSNRLKRAGSDADAPFVTKKGEKILRMTLLDLEGIAADILIEHDNHEELSAYAAERRDYQRELLAGFQAPVSEENAEIPAVEAEEEVEG